MAAERHGIDFFRRTKNLGTEDEVRFNPHLATEQLVQSQCLEVEPVLVSLVQSLTAH